MTNLGILGSTKGTDLQAIIDAIENKLLNAKISIVISNIENAFILERAKNHNIKFAYISHKAKKREYFDREISFLMKENDVDLILLIGFMRILSASFCKQWKNKILNVHPSLLPKYGGGMDIDVHKQVLSNGDKKTGCTIHYVNEDVDQGPILVQKECDVLPKDNEFTLKDKVQKLEGLAYIEAVKIFQGVL